MVGFHRWSDIKAKGRTPEEMARLREEALAEYAAERGGDPDGEEAATAEPSEPLRK